MRFDPITALMVLVLLAAVAGFAAWRTGALDRWTRQYAPPPAAAGEGGPGVHVPID